MQAGDGSTRSAGSVVDAQKVISIYGEWPTFHDAEVLSLALDRVDTTLVAKIWVFKRLGNEVDERAYYKQSDHCIVTFRFDDVEDISVEGFNHQNVLACIVFEIGDRARVHMEGIFGVDIAFHCLTATVEEVVRCQQGEVASGGRSTG